MRPDGRIPDGRVIVKEDYTVSFVKTHAGLGETFYVPVAPALPEKVILRYRNQEAAKSINIADLNDDQWCQHFAHFTPFKGSFERPLALAYHGHQFGHYNPDIGDGRGFLFAQCLEAGSGRLLDLGTKGTGQTPFSRSGDGCLTLKGAVREILATEMLQALGVNSSKTLSVIETGRALTRHDEPSPARSAMLVRLSHSHIRIGSFQRLAYQKNQAAVEQLARYVVRHYYPARDPDLPVDQLLVQLLSDFSEKVAKMTGCWMAAGFVHGVLNTDNFNLTGESFDYGPWRFLPHLDPNFTAAYFDHQGRYAFGRQPDAALWALCRLADCFIECVTQERLESALQPFFAHLEAAMVDCLMRRLGIKDANGVAIMNALLKGARETAQSFDALFWDLYGGAKPDSAPYNCEKFAPYFAEIDKVAPASFMSRDHAYFALPKPASLVIDEVESLWKPIADHDDWSAFDHKLRDIRLYGAMLARYDD